MSASPAPPFEFYLGNGAEGGLGTDGDSYGILMARTTADAEYGYTLDGYVCNSLGDNEVASVCASLGFTNWTSMSVKNEEPVNSKIPFVLDAMWCSSTVSEPALDCTYMTPIGTHSCRHSSDEGVWVTCTGEGTNTESINIDPVVTDGDNDLQFMLTSGEIGYLYTPSGWICDDWFEKEEAQVVCYEMGLGLGSFSTNSILLDDMDSEAPYLGFGSDESSIGLDDFACVDEPTGITSCYWSYGQKCDNQDSDDGTNFVWDCGCGGVFINCTGAYRNLGGTDVSEPSFSIWDTFWPYVCSAVLLFFCFCCIIIRLVLWRKRFLEIKRDKFFLEEDLHFPEGEIPEKRDSDKEYQVEGVAPGSPIIRAEQLAPFPVAEDFVQDALPYEYPEGGNAHSLPAGIVWENGANAICLGECTPPIPREIIDKQIGEVELVEEVKVKMHGEDVEELYIPGHVLEDAPMAEDPVEHGVKIERMEVDNSKRESMSTTSSLSQNPSASQKLSVTVSEELDLTALIPQPGASANNGFR